MPGKKTRRQYNELKDSVKALFDEAGNTVKKAPQRPSKAKRRSAAGPAVPPLEASFQSLLSQRAYDILKSEKERTGEGLPAIVERAVLNLKNPVTEKAGAAQAKEKKPSSSKGAAGDDYTAMILKRMVAMKDEDNLSFEEIAGRFNKEGLRTFSGKGRWHGVTISAIYERFKG